MPIIIDPRTGLPYPVRTDRAPRSRRQGRVPGPADVAKIDAQVLRDPGVHATPDDFGAGVGAALADFADAAGRVASDFATMRREAEDDTAAMAGLSEARVRFTRVAESMETQATTTEGLTGNLGKALSGETDAILRELREVRGLRPSKGGEAAIRRQLGLLASRMVARGAMSEHRIRLAKLGHHVDFSVADAAMAAFDAPGDVFAIMAETEASLARFKGKLPPDILAAKVAAAREMIAGNAVAGLVEQGDVASARTLLEAAGTGDGVSLSPDQADRLRKAVDRVEDHARRARRPAADAEIEDHLASIQATGAGLGGVSERARAALDGKAFKAFQRNEKDAHAFHGTLESLKFAPPDVIGRELESRRPKRGARNFEDKQRRFQVLERGAARMLKLRARDGAAVVMEMGDVKAAFERAGDDGPSLRRALKFRMAMQADIGMPEDRVRLLTRAEAGALASEVQSAATQDKPAKVAGLQDLYGPLFGRAMKELSKAGLDPRFQVLAVARDNPALARAIAQVIGTEHAELEKGLDGAAVKDLRRRLRDLAPDGRSAAGPGVETAREVKVVLSVAENLALRHLRETGDVEESAARAAAFANGAIEEMRLTAADAGEDGGVVTGGDGDNTLAGGTPGKDAVSGADKQEEVAELPVENKALMKKIKDRKKVQKEIKEVKDNPNKIVNLTMEESRIWAILNDKRNVWFNIKDNPKKTGKAPEHRDPERGVKAVRDHDAVIEREAQAQGVDPDLVRAIMYYENADGNVRGLGKLAERVGMADTLLPMNIKPKVWAGMGGVGEEEFKDPEKNIHAAVALIKAIGDRLRPEDRTPAKIGSIYNFTGRENVSLRGARIGRVFDERSWEK